MNEDVTILLAEDNAGHVRLIKKNLKRIGISNRIIHFSNGQEILNFLFQKGNGPKRKNGEKYLLLLDIRMPRVDGVEVLRQIKSDNTIRELPVFIITITDDPKEITHCYKLGCSNYITKPINYPDFINTIKQLGNFLKVAKFPEISGKYLARSLNKT